MARQRTLFTPFKHKYLSNIIDMENPSKAKRSVKQLKSEFRNAKTKRKKLRIARATQLAENRARATLNRKNLSSKEKMEFRKITKIYSNAAEQFFKVV